MRLKDLSPRLSAGACNTCVINVGKNESQNFFFRLLSQVKKFFYQENQSVKCWGCNDFGQSTPPEDLGPVLAASSGNRHSCAIKMDQSIECWGKSEDVRITPPEDLGPVHAVSAGDFHTCVMKMDQSVKCWGDDGYSQRLLRTCSYYT